MSNSTRILCGALTAAALLSGCGGEDGAPSAATAPNLSTTISTSAGAVIAGTSAGRLANAQGVAQPGSAPTSGYEYPVGFLAFDIDQISPGQSVVLTLELPSGIVPTGYVKCVPGCAEFPAAINGNVVTLTLTDGGAGDGDGVADGVIHDPGAPARATGPADSDGDGFPDASDNCPALANPAQADTDGDGTGDACDALTDSDDDTIADDTDNCPALANTDQADADHDGAGDACDADRDGDGAANDVDNCPTVANAGQADSDHDGAGDACDGFTDSDGDGRTDDADNCPAVANDDQADLDRDSIGDACDADRDGDGVTNASDNCAVLANGDQADADHDNVGDACDADRDGDGVDNASDNCPLLANGDQADTDHDGAGDACDTNTDSDGDGIGDGSDNCPGTANADQADADHDSIGDACDALTDSDNDGVADSSDNCPQAANASQADADQDGTGDACDVLTDSDHDTVADGTDNCPAVANVDQSDADHDAAGDACDADRDGDGVDNTTDNCPSTANTDQADADHDGTGDACDPLTDSDADTIADGIDNCPAVANAGQSDTDHDSIGDACDPLTDSDGDAIADAADQCAATPAGQSVDANGCSAFDKLSEYFRTDVQPNLATCRSCHAGGTADAIAGRTLLFQLLSDTTTDYSKVQASWDLLGQGVDDNRILTKPSDTDPEPHGGGKQWDTTSQAYLAMRTVLGCWDDPAQCTLTDNGQIVESLPLLGSSRGGHIWADYCAGDGTAEHPRQPDSAALPADPRSLVRAGFNTGKAVYFNAFWKDCHVDNKTLNLANGTLTSGSDGKPDYLDPFINGYQTSTGWSESPDKAVASTEPIHPRTCGELRANVHKGGILMGAEPFDPNAKNIAFGQPVRHGSVFGADHGASAGFGTFNGTDDGVVGAISSDDYNNLWQAWGLDAKPANFDELVAERYGLGKIMDSQPYPKTGEAVTATFGGSGRLPASLIQLRTTSGAYSGNIGLNCQGCHGVTVGDQFYYGSGGAMLDLSTFGRDLVTLGVGLGAGIDRVGVGGRVRGTNNAQFSNVTAVFGAFNTDTYGNGFNSLFFPFTGDPLFCAYPGGKFCDKNKTNKDVATKLAGVLTNGATGTNDTSAWWNVGHRTVKFVDGMFAGDGMRVDMALFFPLFTVKQPPFVFDPIQPSNQNPFEFAERWVGEHAMYADNWLMTLKAPGYPLPVDTQLAEAGAILFHTKDLWKPSLNNPVAKPAGGNGSCASCHGAYSPRYVNDPSYLADPSLEGVAAYVVPIDLIDTDRARLDTYDPDTNEANSNEWIGYDETGRAGVPTEYNCTVQNAVTNRPGIQKDELGNDRPSGYAAPPLYGVWATAPYFHNGSVPDAMGVLKSSARPAIWRRKSKAPQPDVVMGFDHDLASGYDATRLGWKHDSLDCLAVGTDGTVESGAIPLLECNATGVAAVPTAQAAVSVVDGGILAVWEVTNPPILTNDQVEQRKIYNTAMYSQGNGGHKFTDVLTDAERTALIEYLKTL